MPETDNMKKYNNYRVQMGRLKKAIKEEFYLEAIFIEYAVMEDRLTSILIHSGIFNPEKHRTITKKLKLVESLINNPKSVLKRYISEELILEIYMWKEIRNQLIHALLNQNIDIDVLKQLVTDGEQIIKTLNSKSSLYKRYLERHPE